MTRLTPTASQTVGPFYAYGLIREDDAIIAADGAGGERICLCGFLKDGAGKPVRDALIEVWQADAQGRYPGRDAEVDPKVRGFGRTLTDANGAFRFETVVPGASAGAGNAAQAPHFAVGVFAAGLTRRAVTRIYVPGTDELAADSVLASLAAPARASLIAARGQTPDGAAALTIELYLGTGAATPVFAD